MFTALKKKMKSFSENQMEYIRIYVFSWYIPVSLFVFCRPSPWNIG